jgi:hypothetical protein
MYCIPGCDSSAINPRILIDSGFVLVYSRHSEQREQQIIMKTPSRKQVKAAIQQRGIEGAMMVPKGTLTTRQRRFAEAVAAGETGAAAYRSAYNTKASAHSQSNDATRLKRHPVISQQIDALRLANEAMKYADAASIRQLVIQSLIQTVIDPDVKHATKVQAAKVLGNVTEIAAFTERKEISHVQGSGAIRDQIMDQLKTVILSSGDVETIDADRLLSELAADPEKADSKNADDGKGTGGAGPQMSNEPHPRSLHSNPHEQSQEKSDELAFLALNTETPPLPPETPTPGGDIFGEKP